MTTAQIEQSEVRDAAEAMLGMLGLLRVELLADRMSQDGGGLREASRQRAMQIVNEAIAAAEAAGIRVKD